MKRVSITFVGIALLSTLCACGSERNAGHKEPVDDGVSGEDQIELGDADVALTSDVEPRSLSDAGMADTTEAKDTSTSRRVSDAQSEDDVDAQSDLGQDVQSADATGDVGEDTEGQSDAQAASDGVGADGGCIPQPELCDGIDNDCDGQTDEDFSLTVGPGLSFAVGQSCDNPTCPKGVIVCANPKYAWCSTCPQPIPKTAVLTGPNSKASPLQATGGFVEKVGLLSAVKVYQGSTSQQPEGSAVMALDVDGDDDVDLVVCDGETSVTLFTQTAPWTFASQVIHTSQDGVRAVAATVNDKGAVRLIFGGGGLWAYDRDASGKWVDVSAKTQLKLPTDFGPVSHILPADMDSDGRLDLVVSLFPCKSGAKGLLIYRAKGDGTYVEQSKALGFDIYATLWTALQSDYNGDGRPDLMVLTESCPPMWGVGLYLAQPLGSAGATYKVQKADGVFTHPSESMEFSPMGADVADVNADGVLDYLLAEIELWGYQGNTNPLDLLDPWLYTNKSNIFLLSQPGGGRTRAGVHAGLWAPLSSTKKTMVAWTPAWSDFDHDGHLDLALSHAPHYDAWLLNDLGGMRPVIWRNDGQGHFVDVSSTWGLPIKHSGRSLVLADLDGDGDQDLAVGGMAAPARVWRNDLIHQGGDLVVRLAGKVSNRWGLGARLKLSTNQRTIVAEHSVSSVTQAMAEPKTHFALAQGEVASKLQVTWPSGIVQTQSVVSMKVVEVVEPAVVSLSTRWLPGGKGQVVVTWSAQGTAFSTCDVQVSPATGAWKGAAVCNSGVCTRTWNSNAAAGTSTVFRPLCDGVALRVWPRVDH